MNAIGTQLCDPINSGLTRWCVVVKVHGRRRGHREESSKSKALNTSDFLGFRFFGFPFEYDLITVEAYNTRRQISTGTKFEISYFIIFSKTSDSLVYSWTSYQNNQYNNDDVLFLVRIVNEKVSPLRLQFWSTAYILYCNL